MEKYVSLNAFGYPNYHFMKGKRDKVLGRQLKLKPSRDPSVVNWEKIATDMTLKQRILIYTIIVLFAIFVICVEITLRQV